MDIPVKIFISGYPLDFDEMALVQLVSPYGQVHTIKIVRDKQTGKAKGYAFVEIADRAEAEDVILALDGQPMKDKLLTVKIVEEKPVQAPLPYRKVERFHAPEKKKRPRLSR